MVNLNIVNFITIGLIAIVVVTVQRVAFKAMGKDPLV